MIVRIGGKGGRRLAALLLAGLALAASWLRTPPVEGDLADLELVPLAFEPATVGRFHLTGLWELRSADIRFGGYSALLPVREGRFLAFSDRGRRLAFAAPGQADAGEQADQRPDRGFAQDLFDIESATRDPVSGSYWLGYEGRHAVHRFTADHRADGHVLLHENWPQNGGAESLVRLADGRFALLPEDAARLCLFAGDPVADPAAYACAPIAWPQAGYAATDAAQLPDGRLLVLMRRVELGLPPRFDSLLAIGPLPVAGELWRPEAALRLERLLPHENYEGMALRPLPHGSSEVWLIADDNFSAFQRTLLARLVFTTDSQDAHEKAREGEATAR